MVKKILLVLILLPFLVLLLAPKTELYHLLEKRLAAQDIVISGEQVHTTPIGLSLEHPTFYLKGAPVATAQSVSLWSLLLYSRMDVEGLVFDPSFKNFVPPSVHTITLIHSVVDPLNIQGTLTDPKMMGTGTIDLKERSATLHVSKLPGDSPLKRYLKHTKGGWVYESKF